MLLNGQWVNKYLNADSLSSTEIPCPFQGWIQHDLVRGRVLWCRLLSCVGHVCRPPIHSSLINMLLLKLLYLILSFAVYHEK
jgi:hypothetical protein